MADKNAVNCVLFDLDGTLVDTAPDLIACLNQATKPYAYQPVDIDPFRAFISYGAAALIEQVATHSSTDEKALILQSMLDCYQHNVAQHSQLFTGISELLEHIEEQGLKWGIVTNKRKRFTLPLISALQLSERAACIISGDTTARSKPHPEPMLAACEQAEVAPENCIYIGDAIHDIEAGNSVNMTTLVALYGYLKHDDQPDSWGAHGMIESPEQISAWIGA